MQVDAVQPIQPVAVEIGDALYVLRVLLVRGAVHAVQQQGMHRRGPHCVRLKRRQRAGALVGRGEGPGDRKLRPSTGSSSKHLCRRRHTPGCPSCCQLVGDIRVT